MRPANCQSRLPDALVMVPNVVEPAAQVELGLPKVTWFHTLRQSASNTKDKPSFTRGKVRRTLESTFQV